MYLGRVFISSGKSRGGRVEELGGDGRERFDLIGGAGDGGEGSRK